MSFQLVLFVGLGGFFGTIARYLCNVWIGSPTSTFVVNIIGSFAIGLLLGFGMDSLKPSTISILTVGVLGGFTTFSAFSAESVQMIRGGQTSSAFIYIGLTLAVGLFATYLGFLTSEYL